MFCGEVVDDEDPRGVALMPSPLRPSSSATWPGNSRTLIGFSR